MADLKKHIAPIIEAEKENELARRFDYLMYSIELAMLEQKESFEKYWSSRWYCREAIFNAGFCATDQRAKIYFG